MGEEKRDLSDKVTIDKLDEITKGLGTELLKYFSEEELKYEGHLSRMDYFEKELEKYDLTPDDVYINKGCFEGKLLSEKFFEYRETLSSFLGNSDGWL
jgi:hypothetical protein